MPSKELRFESDEIQAKFARLYGWEDLLVSQWRWQTERRGFRSKL